MLHFPLLKITESILNLLGLSINLSAQDIKLTRRLLPVVSQTVIDLLVNLLYLQEDVFSELLKCGDIV